MNRREAEKILTEGGIEPNEARAEVELIIEEILGKKREDFLLEPDFPSEKILPVLEKRAKTREPVQYILKSAFFMGQKFLVNKDVLIPRDETEILVRKAFSYVKKGAEILDIGTGTGIIPCSLALLSKGLEVKILGIDISNGAINTALENTKKLGLTGTCIYRKSDIFSRIRENEKFDIIVSNPPYIPVKMKQNLQIELGFEPEEALFAPDDRGIYFYEKIIKEAPKFLKSGGYLLFEVMEGQSAGVAGLLEAGGFEDIEFVKDLAEIERVVCAKIKIS